MVWCYSTIKCFVGLHSNSRNSWCREIFANRRGLLAYGEFPAVTPFLRSFNRIYCLVTTGSEWRNTWQTYPTPSRRLTSFDTSLWVCWSYLSNYEWPEIFLTTLPWVMEIWLAETTSWPFRKTSALLYFHPKVGPGPWRLGDIDRYRASALQCCDIRTIYFVSSPSNLHVYLQNNNETL